MSNNKNKNKKLKKMKELKTYKIISNAIKLSFANIFSIIATVFLWVLTIWIPYINVGTTIALSVLPIGISKGIIMSPTEIFKKKYRKYMGEYFVLKGLKMQSLIIASIFIIPYIILNLSWSQSVYLLIDKGINPSKALILSNEITDGYKLKIFIAKFILLILSIGIFYPIVNIAANGYIYKILSKKI